MKGRDQGMAGLPVLRPRKAFILEGTEVSYGGRNPRLFFLEDPGRLHLETRGQDTTSGWQWASFLPLMSSHYITVQIHVWGTSGGGTPL